MAGFAVRRRGFAPINDPLPLTPSIKADSLGTQFQFVAQKNGNDDFDGLSWGRPKATIEAAVAATPNGGVIFIAPGSYAPTSTITVNGHTFIGQIGAGGTNADVTINHGFNGPQFQFQAGGAFSRIYMLSPVGTYTGAALYGLAPTNGQGQPRVGTIYVDHCTFEGYQYNVLLDGTQDSTAGGPGLRQVFFTDCMFFGASGGQNVWLRRVIHCYFKGCEIIQAPASATQVFQIDDNQSEEIQWHGGYIIGNLVSAAGADFLYSGAVGGNVTFAAGSGGNQILGTVTGTATNNGGSSNVVRGQRLWTALSPQNGWTLGANAAWAMDADGNIMLRGFLNGSAGTLTAGTVLATVPVHPPQNWQQGVYGISGAGAATQTLLLCDTAGNLTLETALGTGTGALVRLDGLVIPTS